jgi:hypothetical protein
MIELFEVKVTNTASSIVKAAFIGTLLGLLGVGGPNLLADVIFPVPSKHRLDVFIAIHLETTKALHDHNSTSRASCSRTISSLSIFPDGPNPQPAAVSEYEVPEWVCSQLAFPSIHLGTGARV